MHPHPQVVPGMRLISQMGKLRLSAQETPEELKPLTTVPRKRYWPLAATWPGPQGAARALRPVSFFVSVSTSLPPVSSPELHPGELLRGGQCPVSRWPLHLLHLLGEAHPLLQAQGCRALRSGSPGQDGGDSPRDGGASPVRPATPGCGVFDPRCPPTALGRGAQWAPGGRSLDTEPHRSGASSSRAPALLPGLQPGGHLLSDSPAPECPSPTGRNEVLLSGHPRAGRWG